MSGRPRRVAVEEPTGMDTSKVSEPTKTMDVPTAPVKIVPDNKIDAKLQNIESRVQELENYRNPGNVDNVIRQNQENIEDLSARLFKIEALLKKAYALDKIPDEILKKSMPGVAGDAKDVPHPNM